MKTPEEIEKLAKKFCNIKENLIIDEEERYYKNFQKFDGFMVGYTQCQKDMADKKYTKEDMLKCWNTIMVAMTSKNPIFFKDYIQSINNSKHKKVFDDIQNNINKSDIHGFKKKEAKIRKLMKELKSRLNLLSKENVKVTNENERLKERLMDLGIKDFDVL